MAFFQLRNVVRSVQQMCRRMPHTGPSTKPPPASCAGDSNERRGLILGVYDQDDPTMPNEHPNWTKAADLFDNQVQGRLTELLLKSGPRPANGEVRLFFDLTQEFATVAVVGLGKDCQGYNYIEERDDNKECIRVAAGVGCRAIRELLIRKIYIEGLGHCESAAEGAGLAVWLYQEFKEESKRRSLSQLELYHDCDWTGWQIGLQKASAQNLTRQLAETPANHMTPTMFAQNAVELLCKSNVNVEVKVQGWCETQKMNAFLAVAKGSCEKPIFLELSYYGAPYDERPIVLIGSGLTYSSGGLCLRKGHKLKYGRGELIGAAIVVATIRALAALELPMNIRGLIPLCENMPGCSAMRPGDIVTSMSGKNILIRNTGNEHRLCMADALYYSQNFWPRFVVDIGTFSCDHYKAMDTATTACFTNSNELWNKIHMAGMHTGDRVFRYPLWDFFTRQVTAIQNADITNTGEGRGAGHCKAAAFLREFVPCGEWLHLDTNAVTTNNRTDIKYLRAGMSGRPTRTLIEFISQLVCKECKSPK